MNMKSKIILWLIKCSVSIKPLTCFFSFIFVVSETDETLINISSGEWLFVHFSHVEDGLRARHLNFWGQKYRSTFLHLENTSRVLSSFLIAKPPSIDLHAISGQIVLVLINISLVRGRLVETTPSLHGIIDVFCIDGPYSQFPKLSLGLRI